MPKIVSEALQSRRSTQYCLLSKAHLIVNFTLSSAYTRVCSNQFCSHLELAARIQSHWLAGSVHAYCLHEP